ncbi:hypothetical protein [Chamaesiphon sp.]|uniref:hypothetical protein n=1 Tax=Chamaesiphon sp. TaxID=2814140 RepID=UPI0035932E85
MRNIAAILDRATKSNITRWQQIDTLIQAEYPLGAVCIFRGKYVSHWETSRFELMSVNCQLDIPAKSDRNLLIEALRTTTKSGYYRTLNIEFRGKIVAQGCGDRQMCAYHIEVIEILSVKRSS